MSQAEFAERLRALRTARGMTQRELAGEQLSISYVSLLEAGRRRPTEQTVRLLARALACSEDELVDDAPDRRPPALLLTQAELALQAGQAAAARDRFQQVLAARSIDPATAHRARLGIGQSLQRLGRLEEAADVYRDCLRDESREPASSSSLHAAIGLCRCLYELGELVRAGEVGATALAEVDALGAQESELAIRLIATVAAVWYERGDLREAERLLDEGLRRASQVKSPTARGAILWNASTVAYEKGRYQEALELADEALAIFRGSADRRAVGQLLTVRGYVLLRADPPRPHEAISALQQALAELSETASPIERGYTLTELSHAQLAVGAIDEAVRTAEESRRQLGLDARLESARATGALASALHAQGRTERARDLLTEAGVMLDQIGATRHAARAWVELAYMCASVGDTDAALAAHSKAAQAMNLDDPRWHRNGVLPNGAAR